MNKNKKAGWYVVRRKLPVICAVSGRVSMDWEYRLMRVVADARPWWKRLFSSALPAEIHIGRRRYIVQLAGGSIRTSGFDILGSGFDLYAGPFLVREAARSALYRKREGGQ